MNQVSNFILQQEKKTVTINEWYKIKVEASEKEFSIYLNDTLKSNKQNASKLNFDNKPLFIGGRNNSFLEKEVYGGMFNGELKDLKISTYITNESGSTRFIETILQLSNNTDGVSVIDESGSNNNGYFVKGSELLTQNQNQDITINISPNPFVNQSEIEFNIPEDSYVNFSIYTDIGKHIADLNSGFFMKGKNHIVLSAENLSSGRYLLSINSQSFKTNRYFLVLK